MPSSSAYDSQVYLYALANPDAFLRQADTIKKLVSDALGIAPSAKTRISLSQDSAWLDYTALDELWKRRSPPALPNKTDAKKAAEAALAKLEQKCSDANKSWPDSLRGMALLPRVDYLRFAELNAVARPDGSQWDHWLYRAEPQLVLNGGGKTKAGVFGALVEVRIGHLGRPISIHLRWQPLSGERKLTDPSPCRPPPDMPSKACAGAATKYLLEGDGVPQYYLAPYYMMSDGEDVRMVSGSPYSLTVDLSTTAQGASRMTLTAVAQGGSGSYAYNWATYSVAKVEDGIHEIGGGSSDEVDSPEGRVDASSIDVDNGAYVVMLNVKDLKTGAFKHERRQVYANPFVSDQSEGSPGQQA
jgi:hypothetical protein